MARDSEMETAHLESRSSSSVISDYDKLRKEFWGFSVVNPRTREVVSRNYHVLGTGNMLLQGQILPPGEPHHLFAMPLSTLSAKLIHMVQPNKKRKWVEDGASRI